MDSDSDSDDFVTVDTVRRHLPTENAADVNAPAKKIRTTEVSRGDLNWSQICEDVGQTEIDNLKVSYAKWKCTVKKTLQYPAGHMRW